MRRGAVALIMVLLISVAGFFVLVGWQSRLILAVQRSQSGSDSLRATYSAESEIYDWVARFLGNYPQLFPTPLSATVQILREATLPDGTDLTVSGQLVDGEEILLVTANRQFARTSIEVARRLTLAEESDYDQVEIAISLDCSGSMNLRADPSCSGSCTSRMTEAKAALVNFLDRVEEEKADSGGEFLVGLNVYKRQSYWPTYNGTALTPTSDIDFMQDAVQDMLGNHTSSSQACVGVPPVFPGMGGATNIGDGAVDLARYLSANADARKKQIMILVTDGIPNWSLADTACNTTHIGCGEGGACIGEAIRYLTCGVADSNTQWDASIPGMVGLRSPDTDVYAVTVANPQNPSEQAGFAATMNVFTNPVYVKGYFASENATMLSEFLEYIFGQIIESQQELRVRRVVPNP